ncbi:hypothetical protein IU486_01725 [Streptomyces gardneri]|uniref:hypothetical protein n=1 Tax=Nocardia TaxID=1817 RepID=UPI001356D188|nr:MULTISPECIES: hypothetical protein [Nocardia]MBF6163490.1 hypothetical protein [Streptomyces gardneri]MBF6202538.1 hypothetical protein [Streptomyces gardneri]UAK35100.1 hypothetical protein K8O92_15495 [Nocardia asteroides]
MGNTTNFSANGVAVYAPMAASRGILALQGIGLSEIGGFGTFGTQVNCAAMHASIRTEIQGKPSAGWHPTAAEAALGVFADEVGFEPADPRAARLRTAHPATVNRTRHRCRPR